MRVDGSVVVAGAAGQGKESVPLMAMMLSTCICRAPLIGSRRQFRDMVSFIDEKGIVPAVDDVVLELAEIKEAYRRVSEQKHFAKVVLRVDHP